MKLRTSRFNVVFSGTDVPPGKHEDGGAILSSRPEPGDDSATVGASLANARSAVEALPATARKRHAKAAALNTLAGAASGHPYGVRLFHARIVGAPLVPDHEPCRMANARSAVEALPANTRKRGANAAAPNTLAVATLRHYLTVCAL